MRCFLIKSQEWPKFAKTHCPITIIYNFDGICSYPEQYNRLNAEHLVGNTLFDLKNGGEYSIIMVNTNWAV